MKTPIIPVLSATALAVVSCTSLPGDISAGIKNGNPHAYYAAGKHIDNSKVASDTPALVQLLCLPVNLPLAILHLPRVESCFLYRSVESRNSESAKYYAKGAELGDADCQNEMGLCYEKGYGVPVNEGIARSYYMKSAAQGNRQGQAMLASLNLQSPASLAGKTLVLDFNPASGGDTQIFDWRAYAPHVIRLTGTVVTDSLRRTQEMGRGRYIVHITQGNGEHITTTYNYTKTGVKTAKIEEFGYENGTEYILNFETETSGTLSYDGGGECEAWNARNVKFTIK